MRWWFVLLIACGGIAPHPVAPGVDGDFAATVPDAATWQALAARTGNAVMSRVEVVKVLFDHTDERLYFMQSRRWPIHFDFAERFLSTPGEPVLDHGRFNEHEYRDDDRRFVLGTLTHYLDSERWTFELFAEDRLDVEHTARVFDQIRRTVFFGDKLQYHPVPARQLAVLDQVRAAMPVVTTDELFAGVRYEPIETGEAWGYLRIVPAGAEPPADVHPYDVLVLGTQPLELSPVAAIVTDELQAPLGHLAVLAHSRHTPNMALKHASEDPAFAALAGKPVHVRVGPSDYAIEAATPDDLARAGRARHARSVALKLDVRDVGLPELHAIPSDGLARFGAKTTQLARVARLDGIVTPRAFGLPFHAYLAFLVANGIDRKIAALLADHTLREDDARLRAALDDIRAQIASAPVPATITDPLLARIRAVLPGASRVRLRSSTNSEDLDGFSGAGLYRSTRVDPSSRADVERGLREVWGSVWSYDAFAEREWYGIDHAKVAMAILVQESIDDDVVNGVAITGNPWFEGRPAVYINAQARGGSVTGAAGNEVPEQILVYTYESARGGVERVSRSSRAAGHDLMSDAEAAAFSRELEAIHEEFVDDQVGTPRAVDVEFIVRSNRQLVVLQARPYTLTWSGDRKLDR
ncbi:MAG TPA: PEP/pyruvate-binding domain-containing protein [Kofleriaceae bacterium]|nr:PEP/pyruvate-binding domain-containing protein [Kofleriaceae bacterium]